MRQVVFYALVASLALFSPNTVRVEAQGDLAQGCLDWYFAVAPSRIFLGQSSFNSSDGDAALNDMCRRLGEKYGAKGAECFVKAYKGALGVHAYAPGLASAVYTETVNGCVAESVPQNTR